MRLLILIAGVVFWLGAQAESARNTDSFYDGSRLSQWCDEKDDEVSLIQCSSYIAGVVDSLAATQSSDLHSDRS